METMLTAIQKKNGINCYDSYDEEFLNHFESLADLRAKYPGAEIVCVDDMGDHFDVYIH